MTVTRIMPVTAVIATLTGMRNATRLAKRIEGRYAAATGLFPPPCAHLKSFEPVIEKQ
jgi:hypothetical protein